ncbi:MAG: hypothetical protein IPL33_16330 [Sphingobacteriales bacterium]|nr:hypothetical protein [Sphingobacteriales bacterium]
MINGEYLANMEDILDIYAAPFSGIPRICFDERPCQLIGNVLARYLPNPIALKKNIRSI